MMTSKAWEGLPRRVQALHRKQEKLGTSQPVLHVGLLCNQPFIIGLIDEKNNPLRGNRIAIGSVQQ
jgi:hypothetical protein